MFSRTKYFNDHSKYSLKWFGWKIIKTIFTPPPLLLQHHYVLTGPRNGSYTLGQVILARKRQSVQLVPNLLWPFWGQPVHGPGPHVTDATRNFDRFYVKAETIKLYWNRPDFALDDHVWQQHVVVLSPSDSLWMRQHERGGCLWCEPYNCRHYISIALYHPGSSDGSLALCLCLSVCFCVLAIMTQCSNAKSQPQWKVWFNNYLIDKYSSVKLISKQVQIT